VSGSSLDRIVERTRQRVARLRANPPAAAGYDAVLVDPAAAMEHPMFAVA